MSDTEQASDGNAEFTAAFKEGVREKLGLPNKAPEAEVAELEQGEDEAGLSDDAPPKDAAAPEPAADEIADDLWADADPRLREAFEANRKKLEKAEHAVQSQTGRLSHATNQLNQLRAELASKQDKTAAAPEGEEATDRKERLQQLREEYPDVTAPILDAIYALEDKVTKLSSKDESREAEVVEQLFTDNWNQVAEKHGKDWTGISNSGEFAEWLGRQPSYTQAAVMRNASKIVEPDSVIDVLDRFKAETQKPDPSLAAKRERQLEGNRGVPSRTPGITGGASKADDFSGTWNAELAKRKLQPTR